MPTRVLVVNGENPEPGVIAEAAAVLRGGAVVAFPTETVYGLGANALSGDAVGRIFAAKGRPARNPLIVHVANVESARPLVAAWPESADRLARRFWPGPLTLVLPKSERVPDIVTAYGPTVALRVPAHPVALALLRESGLPLAAPSANRSAHLSPTRAEHVLRGLDGRIDLVLDGGPTSGGLESTVLDLTVAPPRLLRPGPVPPSAIAAVIGTVATEVATQTAVADEPVRSPGTLGRHYAPATPMECVADGSPARVRDLVGEGKRIAWVCLAPLADHANLVHPNLVTVKMPVDPADYAAQMYDVLHRLDQSQLDRIVVELPPDSESWLAIRDRLLRASGRA